MTTQHALLTDALREISLYTLLQDADGPEEALAVRLVALGVVSTKVRDTDGCGTWFSDNGKVEAEPAEWWSCVIPDAEHHGRDHVLVRRKQTER